MDLNLRALRDFRDDFYACLYRRGDALFELTEALLTAGAVPSPVHLSGEPVGMLLAKSRRKAGARGSGPDEGVLVGCAVMAKATARRSRRGHEGTSSRASVPQEGTG